MKIAFVHYHLKPGGVTSVIRQQADVLHKAGVATLLFSGHEGAPSLAAPWVAVPGLSYDDRRDPGQSAQSVADAIEAGIYGHWPQGADIVHVHNPTLAKNSMFQDILEILKTRGHRLLCQIHDFAEDGRPECLFRQPYTRDCHYAVLNQRDYNLLLQAGLKADGLHLLPNPVPPFAQGSEKYGRSTAPVLYPVRALRRKNIGEALLLTRFFKPPSPLLITLPPNSPQDIRSCQGWCSFAKKNDLKVTFDAGLSRPLASLLADCRFILTTSITEGFGYAFLEGWTASRSVRGRLLPEICMDFMDQGIGLDHMYTRLAVPLTWMGGDTVAHRWQSALTRAASRLGRTMTEASVQNAWQHVSQDGMIDFGLLNEALQEKVILRLLRDRRARQAFIKINPMLDQNLCGPGPETAIARNRKLIETCYHPQGYGRKLLHVYEQVMQKDVKHQVDKERLAEAFLAPAAFSLLKWEPYDGQIVI